MEIRSLETRSLLSDSTALLASALGYSGMSFSAAESRKREVALQMASGARSRDILFQHLLESLIIGAIGGMIGIGLGAIASLLSPVMLGWSSSLSWQIQLTGLFTGIFFGGIAGLVPALRVARLDPATAARG